MAIRDVTLVHRHIRAVYSIVATLAERRRGRHRRVLGLRYCTGLAGPLLCSFVVALVAPHAPREWRVVRAGDGRGFSAAGDGFGFFALAGAAAAAAGGGASAARPA